VRYEYTCECGNSAVVERPIAERNAGVDCQCGRRMRRVVGVPYLTLLKFHERDENRVHESAKERLARLKRYERLYEEGWARHGSDAEGEG
jgi:hypothetical protein